MCDPVSLGLAAIGAVGSIGQASSQRSAQKKQQEEVRIWQQQQKQNRAEAQVRQEQLREEGDKARVAGLEEMDIESQVGRQKVEADRLAKFLETGDTAADPKAPVAESDAQLLGGTTGGAGQEFKTELAKKTAESSAEASKRIKALAGMSAYGESFGGGARVNPIIQMEAGAGIDRANEFRRGELGVFNVKQAVEPVQVEWTPSPLGDLFSTALSLGSQGLGAGGIPGLSGKLGGSGLPKTISTIPTRRPSFLPLTTSAIPTPRVF